MKRPAGITGLAMFAFVAAVIAGVAAASLAFPGSPLEPMWQLNPRGHDVLSRMHGWAPLLLAVVSIACGITGVGLWRSRRWGYVLAVTGLAIHLVGDILNVALGIEPRAIIGIPIVAAILVYLSRPRIRSTFGANGVAEATGLPNKGMKLTKLSAAPEYGRPAWLSLRCRLMPAPARMDAGTASQLIPGVRPTLA